MSNQTIGFIGLGMMGRPMSQALARAGFRVAVLDADDARTEALCQEGLIRLTPDNAGRLDALITMLPNSDIVEDVLLAQGWADRLNRGATVIDMSSSEPVRSRELGRRLHEAGLTYLDAPVSGGVKRATDGELSILVGGEAEALQTCRPMLEAMGRSILHIGDAGAGHAAKALNNFVSAAGLMATAEALGVGRRFGIDPAVMTDVLNASTGRSNTSENKVKQFMLSESFASGFSLRLMDKDLGIAASLAESVDHPLDFGRHCIDTWHAVAERVEPTADHTEMYRFLNEKGQ